MTNEEAIKKITHIKYCYAYEGDYEAFDMAIKALSADIEEDVARRIATIIKNEQDMRVILKNADRPIGKWIRCKKQNKADLYNGNALYECSNCGHTDLHAETQEVPYCWYCGVKMVKEDGEE